MECFLNTKEKRKGSFYPFFFHTSIKRKAQLFFTKEKKKMKKFLSITELQQESPRIHSWDELRFFFFNFL